MATPDDAATISRRTRLERAAFVGLAGAWILLLYSAFNTLIQGDSAGYLGPGCMLWGRIPVQAYDGARTPLYPLFLTALQHLVSGTCSPEPAHGTLDFISGAQLLLYLASVVYLYRALEGFRPIVRLAGMAAVALSPLHALFARQILSEALTAPLVLAFTAHLVRFGARGRAVRDATALFVLYALLVLSRPNLLYVLLPAVAYVTWAGPDRRRLVRRALVAAALPILLSTTLNYVNTRHFKLTNIEGYARTQIVYDQFDKVHEADAVLGAIMSRQRALDLQSGNADGQVVWRAMPEIQGAIDRMPYPKWRPWTAGTSDLNAYLGHVSGYLLRENPGAVVRSSWRTFLAFWEVGEFGIPAIAEDPHSPGHDRNIRSELLYRLFLAAQPVTNAIVRATLVLLPALLLVIGWLRGPARAALPALLYATYLANMAMVSLFNVVQVRYVTVLQPLLLVGACLAVEALLPARAARAESEGAARPRHAAP
jgi:hypothetical protein